MIQFAHPGFLLLLLALPLLAIWRGQRGPRGTVTYSSLDLIRSIAKPVKSPPGGWVTHLRLFSLGLLILALARPQLDRSSTEIQASGVDLILAVDISTSMDSLDFRKNNQPISRIDVLKPIVSQFIEDRPNDRIGLVAFAARPYLLSPLTLDHNWLQKNLLRLDTGIVDDGTAIGSGLAASVNHLRDQKAKSRIVILLTDGVNNQGSITPLAAAEAAKALDVKVYTIGVGKEGTVPMPVRGPFGIPQYAMVETKIDEEILRQVAQTTGGLYFRATDTDSLKKIYTEIDKMEKTSRTTKRYEQYDELFAWLLLPGIILLGLELGLAHTRFRRIP